MAASAPAGAARFCWVRVSGSVAVADPGCGLPSPRGRGRGPGPSVQTAREPQAPWERVPAFEVALERGGGGTTQLWAWRTIEPWKKSGSLKMDASKGVQPTGEFTCQLCGLTAPYIYYGQKPPNTRSIVLLEESYVMKDPFTPDKDKFLILGSHCSLCSRSVCVGTECSLFYSKRFCLPCVNENLKAFPLEIQEDMDKRKAQQKSFPCKKMDTGT
ncbi:cysteine-rich DPF motif domain-containing protein 1 isoform X1 [Falco cherrug]|uniref:cysteine-rich DPF motif domain-containing protein 1 isoform X1 n=1 Tax=Falco cherrug TaxID=345164 RepID=UPI00247A0177|nr:cysteine-rich DPF motif domain-containing protein 1 isoform X1 [Falco cherrug]